MDSDRAWELPPPDADRAATAGWDAPGHAAPGQGPQGIQGQPGQPGYGAAGYQAQDRAGWATQDQAAGWGSPGQPAGWGQQNQAGWGQQDQAAGWGQQDQAAGWGQQNQAGWGAQAQPAGWAPPGQPGWAPPPAPGWAPAGQAPPGQAGWAPPPGQMPPGQILPGQMAQGQVPPAGYAPGQAGWAPPGQPMYQQQVAPYPGQGWPAVAPMPMQVAAKSPALHALASAFLPGLGSMLAGNGGIGALILVVYIVGWFLAVVIIGFPILLGAWIWGIVNGHSSAVTWNRNHGIIS